MKITKQRIKEIIKEEMELASSKMDLKRKMKEFSDALTDDKFKIEPAEAEEVDRMMTRILAAASAEEISTVDLRKANEYVAKYLNVDTITEDVLEEAQPTEIRNAKSKFHKRFLKAKNAGIEALESFIQQPPIDEFDDNQPYKESYLNYVNKYVELANKEIKVLKAAAQASTPQEQKKVEKAQDQLDQVEDRLEQEAEAEVTAEPETGAEEQPQGPINKFINTDLMKTIKTRDEETYNGLVLFLQKLMDNNLIKESLVGLVRGLKLSPKEVKSALESLEDKNKKAVIKFFSNPEYTEQFVKMINPDATIPTGDQEQPKADEQGVVELPSGDSAIPSQFDELVDVFKRFSDDDKGFMMKTYLVEQDKLLGELRSALRRFIGLEGLERSLRTEQEEQQPQAKPEDKIKGSRESLVKYVSRYRRDINNTSKVMGEYLTQAQAGTYKAQPILNKLKIQLQRLQDDNVLIVRDLKKLAGLKESLLLEEESREEKIAKVRAAYDQVINLLRPLLNVGSTSPDEETPSEESSQDQQNEELVLEDIYLEQVRPSEEELQSYVNAVKDALIAIDSIKGYFRLTGTFNRPLEEVKNDFVKYIQDYKKTMSDLVSDLRSGVPVREKADQYVEDFARLAKQIQDDFGVSPKEPIKTPEVTVNPEGTEDNTPAVADNSSAEQAAEAEQIPKVQPDFEDEPEAPTGPRPDDITDTLVLKKFLFDKDSEYFKPSEMNRIFGEDNKAAFAGIRRLLTTLFYSKILRDRYEAGEVPIKNTSLQEREEPDDNRLKRLGQEAGYNSIVIDNFLNFIKDKKYRYSEDGEKKGMLYSDVLSFITGISDQNLRIMFNKLKQVEDDLKQADVAFNVDSNTLKRKINQNLGYLKAGPYESKKHNKSLLERLIKQELKVLNGKKMVRN